MWQLCLVILVKLKPHFPKCSSLSGPRSSLPQEKIMQVGERKVKAAAMILCCEARCRTWHCSSSCSSPWPAGSPGWHGAAAGPQLLQLLLEILLPLLQLLSYTHQKDTSSSCTSLMSSYLETSRDWCGFQLVLALTHIISNFLSQLLALITSGLTSDIRQQPDIDFLPSSHNCIKLSPYNESLILYHHSSSASLIKI